MPQTIKPITLPLPYRLGRVNCYLVEAETGFALIDTGAANSRAALENELARAGCRPGDLKLIVLTHGDFDHTGNAAYLHQRFGAPIAMHGDDAGMAAHGDMFWNRSSGNRLIRILARILFGFSRANRFTPGVSLEEGEDLSAYGLDARVVSIPGHSQGSMPKMADTLQAKAWTLVGEPGGFFVRGLKKGPLKRGEADRAAAWAEGLVAVFAGQA